ncbi:conserved hypothetical protein [Hyella patelloides LEGE 07179]|uniref:DUF4168 domain-containing protein n=1 Tax=Hyella patelloides LEGE 07179 TaxID=945734 RepID=A0A563VYD2_9CYAN|nr:DUF4168 domain-containing protein [Hyella patelloides]VEP16468.1 conserved hypothetical protein [Hyella patelloides LEGE 07179]
MFIIKSTLYKLNKINRSLAGGILAAMGIISGITPEISVQPHFLNWENAVYAQNFTPEEVYNYARAGFEVEVLRQQVYQEIKSMVNQPPPEITCDRPETMNDIPENVRGIANNYCNRSRQIVQENNLSIQRFNQLKNNYDSEGSFYQQVQQKLLDLQN